MLEYATYVGSNIGSLAVKHIVVPEKSRNMVSVAWKSYPVRVFVSLKHTVSASRIDKRQYSGFIFYQIITPTG